MNEQQNKADLELLLSACREASDLAMRYFGKNPQVWLKAGNSPVSAADLAVDKFLKQRLLTERPDYGWISEETTDDRPAGDYHRFFVVDPIDGTRGFLDGSQYWCISVAVIENGRPVAGVLHCPVNGDVYAASLKAGAFINDKPLKKLEKNVRSKALVSFTKSMEKKLPEAFRKQVSFYNYIPSLAYRIALLSEGKIDIVLVRKNCHDWDIAAADLILSESGGCLLDSGGRHVLYGSDPFTHGFLIATEIRQAKDVIDVVHAAKLG